MLYHTYFVSLSRCPYVQKGRVLKANNNKKALQLQSFLKCRLCRVAHKGRIPKREQYKHQIKLVKFS